MQIKTIMRYYIKITRMTIIKMTMTSAAKIVNKLEPSNIADGNVKWYYTLETA